MRNDKPYPAPPEHLSERSRVLWAELGPIGARSLGRQTIFQSALEALDSADEARRIVREAGLFFVTKTTGAVHVHPAVKVEREARLQFARLWSSLSLQFPNEN